MLFFFFFFFLSDLERLFFQIWFWFWLLTIDEPTHHVWLWVGSPGYRIYESRWKEDLWTNQKITTNSKNQTRSEEFDVLPPMPRPEHEADWSETVKDSFEPRLYVDLCYFDYALILDRGVIVLLGGGCTCVLESKWTMGYMPETKKKSSCQFQRDLTGIRYVDFRSRLTRVMLAITTK